MKYAWTIIGAGPAGILTVGQLLEYSVPPRKILWLDDEFNVGRLGKYYKNVPSNDTVQDWVDMLQAYPCFSHHCRDLQSFHPESNQPLAVIVSILTVTTAWLKQQVTCHRDYVEELDYKHHRWELKLKHASHAYKSKNVVLATGSHPISLNYATPIEEIPLDTAIDRYELARLVVPTDRVAIIGSGQSAVLLLKFLTELGVSQITNFYTLSLQETLASLKAETLAWAEANLVAYPVNGIPIHRVYNDDANRDRWLSQCNKIIYAVGYERNPLPKIRHTSVDLDNNQGILGPHLFGVGIAFPEREQHNGRTIRRVGMMSFTRFLLRNMPIWIQHST
jgi:hypothetical protein